MDPTVAGIIVVAVVSVLIYGMRTLLTWGLGKKALEQGASLKVSGLNPLAPTVEVTAPISTIREASGPSGEDSRRKQGRERTGTTPVRSLKRAAREPAA